jgi:hypothetical protein
MDNDALNGVAWNIARFAQLEREVITVTRSGEPNTL